MNNSRRRNFRSRIQKNNFRRRNNSVTSNKSNNFNINGNVGFGRNGSMNNLHNVEKTMHKFQQLAKDAQSNGDPVLAQNYLQHADHYLRRYNELNERKEISQNTVSEDKDLNQENSVSSNWSNYLSSANFKSILILFNSKSFLGSPLRILPEGNFNFCELTFFPLTTTS